MVLASTAVGARVEARTHAYVPVNPCETGVRIGIDERVVIGGRIAFVVTPFIREDDLGFCFLLFVPG